jgi:hypothetical protein
MKAKGCVDDDAPILGWCGVTYSSVPLGEGRSKDNNMRIEKLKAERQAGRRAGQMDGRHQWTHSTFSCSSSNKVCHREYPKYCTEENDIYCSRYMNDFEK